MSKLTFIMPYRTEKDIEKAEAKREKLYDQFDRVEVYIDSQYTIRITATKN